MFTCQNYTPQFWGVLRGSSILKSDLCKIILEGGPIEIICSHVEIKLIDSHEFCKIVQEDDFNSAAKTTSTIGNKRIAVFFCVSSLGVSMAEGSNRLELKPTLLQGSTSLNLEPND